MGATLSDSPMPFSTQQLIRELELRRGEVEAVQEVVRLLAPRIRDTALLISVASILRSRFGVQRLAYIHTFTPEHQPKLAYFHNFPSISQEALKECITYTTTSIPKDGSFIAHMGADIVMPLGRYVGPTTRVRIVEPRAWWLLGEFADTEEEKANDLLYLEIIGSLITVYLENSFFQEQQQQAEILKLRQRAQEQEIAVASRIQRRILSSSLPTIHKRLDTATFHISHGGIGGDLFEFIPLDNNRVLFYIGDVSGKGISAAIVMSNVQGQIRTLAELGTPLPRLLNQLHRRLLQLYGEEDGFVTLFIGEIELKDSQTATLRYLNAGHQPAFLLREGKTVDLPATHTVLGLSLLDEVIPPGTEPIVMNLSANDVLFAYTDGLIEQTNSQGEQLGIDRLRSHLRGCTISSAESLLAQVRFFWEGYRGNLPPEDDTSLLVCRLL
ncbi:MAG: serine/threonine-protein phosphatase [Bacteroidia bacterium]|nr:serine/threonine-protein phosphatase [Bacteroidia bacterium]MDW8417302.1 PP2C family protein-serine/threonine phosphatase [Bacteroidia bacterium]